MIPIEKGVDFLKSFQGTVVSLLKASKHKVIRLYYTFIFCLFVCFLTIIQVSTLEIKWNWCSSKSLRQNEC